MPRDPRGAAGTLRVIVEDEPRPGAWNMAVDEVLLESALSRGMATLRLYRWREATVSLGYFQKLHAQPVPADLANLPLVRRLSGGGAILHHHEWTYSCAIPPMHDFSQDPGQLYDAIHTQIIGVLTALGISSRMRGTAVTQAVEPFLCFRRGDPRDIVIGGVKVVGSAQRRRRGAVLQHGSLLLRHSEFATEAPGILDLTPELVLPEKFPEILADAVAGAVGDGDRREALGGEEHARAARLAEHKYSRMDWRVAPEPRIARSEPE